MRITRSVGLLFSIILLITCLYEASTPKLIPAAEAFSSNTANTELLSGGAPEILRLHVVANSNSDEDQRVKLLVRDALVKEFAPAGSKDEAERILLKDGGGVLETVQRVLHDQNCSYGAQLKLGVLDFPDRTYDGIVFPAGQYEALRVELGSAQGKNWWCVLFPPLCLVDAGVQDIPDSDKLIFESDIAKLLKEWKEKDAKK